MEFKREGLEELYTDGVLNPAVMSADYLQNASKYRELDSRVFVLYEPDSTIAPNGAEFDIVLLHGIGSDEFHCWTNAQGIVWPAIFFPQDFPTARVLTVGYAHSLFNWKADGGENEKAAKVESSTAASSSASSHKNAVQADVPPPASPSTQNEGSGPLHHMRSLADKVGLSAKESVSAFAPQGVAEWWSGNRTPAPLPGEEKVVETLPAAIPANEEKNSAEAESMKTSATNVSSQEADNPLFQLLSRIRDSTGALVAAEDESSAKNLSGAAPEQESDTGAGAGKKASRDVRSLQNMRIVAAEMAERLCGEKVGVGTRPVVFLVHSMGGLILKQMLISLFEAARLAPPSAKALSIAAAANTGGETVQSTAARQNFAAVQKASMLLRAVRGVVFYGTPHFGSAVASVITGLQKYYQGLGGLTPTNVVTGLGDHNKQELMRLNDRFFDIVERLGSELPEQAPEAAEPVPKSADRVESYVSAMESSLERQAGTWMSPLGPAGGADAAHDVSDSSRGTVWVLSFGETKKLNGLVRVVDPESANPAPDDPRYPFYLVNADHGEVCRPLTKMSPSYAMVYGLLDRMQQRGLLRWHGDRRLTAAASSPAQLPASSSAASEAPEPSTEEKLSEAYEQGWQALFDAQRVAPAPSTSHVERSASAVSVPSLHAESQTARSQRSVVAFQQGLGEMRLALPVLEEALAGLQRLLHRFFGVAVPPQLDSIFLLAADVTDFVTRYYRREALVLEVGAPTAAHDKGGDFPIGAAPHGGSLVDEVVSFRVPLQLLTYWVQQAADLLQVFEQSQQERAVGVDALGGASPTAAKWESNLSMHPGSRDFRELAELEQSVGVVQEEWEAFRRYVSLRVRATASHAKKESAAPSSRGTAKRAGGAGGDGDAGGQDVDDFSAREHIAVLFFARAIRTIVSQHLHDGGALGGLLGAYLRSAILQIRGAEKSCSPASFSPDPWSALEGSASFSSGAIVSLVMEGLELSLAPSRASEDGSVLVDTSGSGVELTSSAELRAVVPALTATSAVLLGYFALYIDKLHRLDAGAQRPRAAQHFRLAATALKADYQVRSRLMRAATRTMRSEGLLSTAQQRRERKGHATEKEWWKAAWEITTSKADGGSNGTSTASAGAAAAAVDARQPHVGKLDDGLFLSAMQLTTESFQCSIYLRGYISHENARDAAHDARPKTTSDSADMETKTEGGEEKAAATASAAALRSLVQGAESAQKTYNRTTQIVRGVFEINDKDKPFASQKPDALKEKNDGESSADCQPERSMKDQFRDAIRNILSELEDSDEAGKASEEGAGSEKRVRDLLKEKAGRTKDSLSWTSRASPPAKGQTKSPSSDLTTTSTKASAVSPAASKAKRTSKNSLPMFIMNSLSKAWEAVRSGGAEIETPEHFAFNAMILWWMVEWEAASVIKAAAAAAPPAAMEGSASIPLTSFYAVPRTQLCALADKMEAAQRRRRTAAAAATPKAVSKATKDSPAPTLARATEEEKCERACWANANAAVRCRWMTLQGGEEFLDNFFNELLAERETLGHILTSPTADRLLELQKKFVPPVALVQLDIEGGTQLGIPSSLLDAVQHDDTSAALRCWLGHCYAAHRIRSPDTAHAYMRVIRNDYAAHKTYTPTAEVGLAWSHVHNVSCNFSQLWRTSLSHTAAKARTEERSQEKSLGLVQGSSRDLDTRVVTALLDFRSTGVIDTSALLSVPQPLTQFCHDAVVHHTLAVEEYRREQRRSKKAAPAPATLQPLSLFAHSSATASAARHLQLAEDGFQRALRADPANIGALCGLGRLRCLSVSPPSPIYTPGDAFSSGASTPPTLSNFTPMAPSVDYNGAGASPSTQAIQYFSAALNNARAPSHVLAAGRRASPENCAHAMDDVWLSYAAYWLAEELRRAHVEGDAQQSAPLHTSPSAASQEWLERSLRYYPRNDWALTTLGLLYLHGESRASGHLVPQAQDSENERHHRLHHRDERRGGVGSEVDALRGLTLLQRALAINPTNMWTLWGIGTYGRCAAQRDRCQRLLRTLLVKGIPKLH